MWFETIAAAEARMDDYRREAERIARTTALLRDAGPRRPGVVRHAAAVGLAAVSRGSAAAARRLDDCIADDLGRRFATDRI